MDSATTPAAFIATRDTIDFVNPSVEVNAGNWSLCAGTTALLGLRLWCKIHRRHGLWWDDYILIASWLVLIVTCILISVELATGYVVKTWDDRMLILVSISSVLTMVGQAWSKTAFAVTLLRPGITNGWLRWTLWFFVGSLNVYLVTTIFLQFTNYCGEKAYWWKMPGVCMDYQLNTDLKMGRNIYNIVTDFILALFPWVVTWGMRIKKIEKIGVCATMSLGVVVAIISTWRTVYMMEPGLNNYDSHYFWRQGLSMVWYQAEVAGTIIVQTLPVIRHLARDESVQKSVVRVRLNEVSTSGVDTKIWDGSFDSEKYTVSVGTKDLESGVGTVSSPRSERRYFDQKKLPGLPHLEPIRASWSTFSPLKHQQI